MAVSVNIRGISSDTVMTKKNTVKGSVSVCMASWGKVRKGNVNAHLGRDVTTRQVVGGFQLAANEHKNHGKGEKRVAEELLYCKYCRKKVVDGGTLN